MKWVTIKTYNDLMDANVAKSLLEGSGIRCMLANDTVVSAIPVLANGYGGIELRVTEADEERAMEVLSDLA